MKGRDRSKICLLLQAAKVLICPLCRVAKVRQELLESKLGGGLSALTSRWRRSNRSTTKWSIISTTMLRGIRCSRSRS
jgi:hypothetical protein